MTDADAASDSKRPTVVASANVCLESFQQCLLQASFVHPRELSMVEDQVARFSTWTTGTKVFAPGRASMDHRLRYAPEVQSVVIGLLESLTYRIRTCRSCPFAESICHYVPTSRLIYWTSQSNVYKDSEFLDVFGKSPATNAPSVSAEAMEQSFRDIVTEISRLNKISNTIRRASREVQILRASDFRIKDDDGNDVEQVLLGHFELYIRDRFPNISDTLRQRLARGMLLRRKRILYRRHRQGNTAIQLQNTVPEATIKLPAGETPHGSQQKKDGQFAAVAAPIIVPSQIKSATTLAPDKFNRVASSPSVISASKTVALGNHEALSFPPAPGLAAKRKYEQLKSQRITAHKTMLDKLELPTDMDSYKSLTRRPSVADETTGEKASVEAKLEETLKLDLQAIGEITCPYCLYALRAEEVFDERKWQNHVKNDLDPYICLFEDCDQLDELYSHSDGWLSHLHQHSQRWYCSSHRELGPFPSREEYTQHMREGHNTKLSDSQLRALAKKNTRKMVKLFASCPLCGEAEAEVDGCLEDHITGHLRSLALKSLPSYQDDSPDDVGSGKDSVDASQPRSRSTIKILWDDEDLIAIGTQQFWDHCKPQPTERNPTNFLGDAYSELDSSQKGAWIGSWDFVSGNSLGSPQDDPIIQSMLQLKKKEADDQKSSPDLLADRDAGDLLRAYEDDKSRQDDNASTMDSMSDLVVELSRKGKDDEAEPLFRETLQLREKVLGKEHPDTLTTMSNLAGVLGSQGKYADAEAMHRQTLELREEVLGKTHPDTLATMSNLARVLDSQGKYADAEAIYRQTLEIMEEVLGKTYPDTLVTMSNLARVLGSQGKYADAEAMHRQTLELREEVLGKTHPDTLATMSNLARVLGSQGKYADAEAMHRQTLELRREVLGKTHPSTLTTMSNLALVLNSQGKYADAEAMYRQTLEIMEEVLGKTHPSTLTTMSNLALVLNSQGKYADAEAMYRQTLEIMEEVLGKTHPSTLTTISNLALVLSRQGKYADAEAIHRQTLEIKEEVLGKTHPDTLMSVYCLAYVLQNKREYDEASLLYQRACTGYRSSLGPEHPITKACVTHYSIMLNSIKRQNK